MADNETSDTVEHHDASEVMEHESESKINEGKAASADASAGDVIRCYSGASIEEILNFNEDQLGTNYFFELGTEVDLQQYYEQSSVSSTTEGFADVMQRIRKKLSGTETGAGVKVRLYFVHSSIAAFVGTASLRADTEGQSPKDEAVSSEKKTSIGVEWERLMYLPSTALEEGSILHDVLRSLCGHELKGWCLKAVKDEHLTALEEVTASATEEDIAAVMEKVKLSMNAMDTESTTAEEQVITTTTADDKKISLSNADKEGTKRSRTEVDRKSEDADDSPTRSRIPFNVIGMTYEDYCSRHYSLAIEEYRRKKSKQRQNSGMMPPPMPAMGQYPMSGPYPMMQPMMGMMPPMMGMMPGPGGGMPGVGMSMMGMGPGMNMGAAGGTPQYNNLSNVPPPMPANTTNANAAATT